LTSVESGFRGFSLEETGKIDNIPIEPTFVREKMAGTAAVEYNEEKDPAPYKVIFKEKLKPGERFVSIDKSYVAKKLSNLKYSDYIGMKNIARDAVVVNFATVESANKCLKDEKLSENFITSIPAAFVTVSGVIKGLNRNHDFNDAIRSVKFENDNVISVKRLTFRDSNGKMQPCNKLAVTFRARKLPDTAVLYGELKKIHPFWNKVDVCGHCGVIGHRDFHCRSKQKEFCSKCFHLKHENPECEVKCRNCRGTSHLAGDSTCPELAKAKKYKLYMNTHNVGYYEARKRLNEISNKKKKSPKAPVNSDKEFPVMSDLNNKSSSTTKSTEPKSAPSTSSSAVAASSITPAQRATYAENLKRKSSESSRPAPPPVRPNVDSRYMIDLTPMRSGIDRISDEQWQQLIIIIKNTVADTIHQFISMNAKAAISAREDSDDSDFEGTSTSKHGKFENEMDMY
jgi:hypothetical protein